MSDEQPYLILHKVRGLPAFDIATKLMIGDEEGWIIPTSGHRAFPFSATPLDVLAASIEEIDFATDWADWPDHYPPLTPPRSAANMAQDLLDSLGIKPEPKPSFLRR